MFRNFSKSLTTTTTTTTITTTTTTTNHGTMCMHGTKSGFYLHDGDDDIFLLCGDNRWIHDKLDGTCS